MKKQVLRVLCAIMSAVFLASAPIMAVKAMADEAVTIVNPGDAITNKAGDVTTNKPGESVTVTKPGDGDVIPSSNLVIMSYSITKESNRRSASQIERGDRVSIELKLKNTSITTKEAGSSGDIDVTKLVDSFYFSGTPYVKVTSDEGAPLTLTVRFSDATYSGSGKALRFIVGYKNLALPYDSRELMLSECKEYEEPKPGDKVPETVPNPFVQIGRGELSQPVKAGQEFTLSVFVKNLGVTTMETPFVSFSASDSLIVMESVPSRALGNIAPGKSESFTVKLKATAEIASPTQTLNIDVKYNYISAGVATAGTASEKLIIPAEARAGGGDAAPTPYMIISKYDFGKDIVTAGDVFELSLEFMNTSAWSRAENIVMTLETGEGLTLYSSSNTFYYAGIAPGAVQKEKLKVQAMPSALSAPVKIDVGFKYEFVDGGKRTQVTSTEKITVPITQPDRFEITQEREPGDTQQNTEVSVSLAYVNKGKNTVSNVEAVLEGDVAALSKIQHLGNFEAGKNGTIDFILTPENVGRVKFVIKVTYEDSNQKLRTKEFPMEMNVTEAMTDFDPGMVEPEPPASGGGWYWWLLLGVAIAAPFAFIIWRKRLKAGKEASTDLEWEDDFGDQPNAEQPQLQEKTDGEAEKLK